jgi:hypothetical protein
MSPESLVEHRLMTRQDVLQGFEAQARSRLITSVWTSLKPSPFAVLPVSTSLNSTPFVVPHRSTVGGMPPRNGPIVLMKFIPLSKILQLERKPAE